MKLRIVADELPDPQTEAGDQSRWVHEGYPAKDRKRGLKDQPSNN